MVVNIVSWDKVKDRGLSREHNDPQPFNFDVGNKEQFPDLAVPVPSKWAFDKYLIGGILPLEIRENIWEHAMRGGSYRADSRYYTYDRHLIDPIHIRSYPADHVKRPRFLPSLCFLTKSTTKEITEVFIRSSTFMVASYPANQYLQAWLGTINGIRHVRSLQFDFFDCFPENIAVNSDLKLAATCTGLTEIRMAFHWNALLVFDSMKEAFPRYHLDQLLECGKLERIVLHRKTGNDLTGVMLAELGTLLEAKFAEKGRRVTSVVI